MLNVLTDALFVSALAGALALLVAALRPLLARRYTARLRCALWWALALWLCLPFKPTLPHAPVQLTVPQAAVEQPVSTGQAVPGNVTGPTAGESASPAREEPQPQTGAVAAPPVVVSEAIMPDNAAEAQPAQTSAHQSPAPWQLLAILWAAIAAVVLAVRLAGYLAWRRRVLRWNAPVTDRALLENARSAARAMGLRHPVRIFANPRVDCPVTVGLFRPAVLVPETLAPGDAAAMMLLHECTHLHRRDLWLKFVLVLATSLHWFNPAVWVMARVAGQDIELACDEQALQGRPKAWRDAYGQALLTGAAGEKKILLATHFSVGKRGMMRRLRGVFDTRRKRRGVLVFAALLLAAAMTAAMVACTPAQSQTTPENAAPSNAPEQAEATVPGAVPIDGAPVLDYDAIMPAGNLGTWPQSMAAGLFTMEKDGLWGLMQADGAELLPCRAPVPVSRVSYYGDLWLWNPDGMDHTEWESASHKLQASGAGGLAANAEEIYLCRFWYNLDAPGLDHTAMDSEGCYVQNGDYLGQINVEDWDRFGELLPMQCCHTQTSEYGAQMPVPEGDRFFYVTAGGTSPSPKEITYGGFFKKETLAPVCMDGKWAYMDRNGNLMTGADYDPVFAVEQEGNRPTQAAELVNGYAAVSRQGRWGLLDETGAEVIPCRYDGLAWTGQQLWVRQEDGWHAFRLDAGAWQPEDPEQASHGLLTRTGNTRLTCDEMAPAIRLGATTAREMAGYYTMRTADGWGLMRSDGTQLLPCMAMGPVSYCWGEEWHWYVMDLPYDTQDRYSERLEQAGDGRVSSGGHGGRSNTFVYSSGGEEPIQCFATSEGMVSRQDVSAEDWQQYGSPLPARPCRWREEEMGPMARIEVSGMPLRYYFDDGSWFAVSGAREGGYFGQEPLAPVRIGDHWAYVDRSGNLVTDAVYDSVFPALDSFTLSGTGQAAQMHSGYAAVCRAGRWGMIDSTGREVLPCRYDGVAWDGGTLWIKLTDGWYAYAIQGLAAPQPAQPGASLGSPEEPDFRILERTDAQNYYAVVQDETGVCWATALDLTTGVQRYLCAKPGCPHTGADCDACLGQGDWTGYDGEGLFVNGDELLQVFGAMDGSWLTAKLSVRPRSGGPAVPWQDTDESVALPREFDWLASGQDLYYTQQFSSDSSSGSGLGLSYSVYRLEKEGKSLGYYHLYSDYKTSRNGHPYGGTSTLGTADGKLVVIESEPAPAREGMGISDAWKEAQNTLRTISLYGAERPLLEWTYGEAPLTLAATGDAIYLIRETGPDRGRLLRMDPETGEITAVTDAFLPQEGTGCAIQARMGQTMILSATGQKTRSRVWYAANLDTGAVQAIHCADADRISIAAHNETSLLLCRTAPDGTLSYSVISLRDFLDGKAPTPCTLCRSEFAGTLAAP